MKSCSPHSSPAGRHIYQMRKWAQKGDMVLPKAHQQQRAAERDPSPAHRVLLVTVEPNGLF